LTTPWEEVVRTLAQIPEKGSIRGIARSSGHDKSTICKWVDLAGKHCEEVTDYFLRDLHLDRVQVDEIWSYIKKAKEYHRRRSR
jgi:diaminopimelate decarboxylase